MVFLTAIVATSGLIGQQLDISRVGSAVSDSGAYWTVAQFQIAHQRLKQELRAIAAGEPARMDELSRRSAVLASKTSLLTEPSEVQGLLKTVPGYTDAARQLVAIQQRIGPLLGKVPFTQADAAAVLGELKGAGDRDLINELANHVRLNEIAAKQAALDGLARRNHLLWAGFAICWTALLLWLIHAARSRRRFQAAASDRQRAIDALEHALRAKRRFLSMVNHEVRSPLQSIVSASELLALQPAGAQADRAETAAAIRRIRHAVTVLQGQLRDLLTIARGESEQLSTQAETFEFRELVNDVCADQQEAAQAKGLICSVEVPATPVTVHADPIRIAQVLRNLVENAVRYTAAGRIHVRLAPLADNASGAGSGVAEADSQAHAAPAGHARFTVEDTGPGLPPSALERLQGAAVPFESAAIDSGIGLFVIRELLQQLGGRIQVQSLAPQGTRFTVTVPAPQVKDAAPDSAPSGPLKVVIVDDRADVLGSLSQMTRSLGHTCQAVDSAAAAQELLASHHCDVALIDLEMPGQDGLSLATRIRQDGGPNSAAMLILISAAENQSVGQQWPFDGFLQKPITAQALAQLIGSQKPH